MSKMPPVTYKGTDDLPDAYQRGYDRGYSLRAEELAANKRMLDAANMRIKDLEKRIEEMVEGLLRAGTVER